jgi:integration host factor subunit alpha
MVMDEGIFCGNSKGLGRFLQAHPRRPPMTLTKDALISEVAKENGSLRSQSAGIIETLLELIKSKLVSGEDVLISGFGKFCVKEKRERRGRNPATGEDMMLKARKVVTFKCSGQLREKICNPHQ